MFHPMWDLSIMPKTPWVTSSIYQVRFDYCTGHIILEHMPLCLYVEAKLANTATLLFNNNNFWRSPEDNLLYFAECNCSFVLSNGPFILLQITSNQQAGYHVSNFLFKEMILKPDRIFPLLSVNFFSPTLRRFNRIQISRLIRIKDSLPIGYLPWNSIMYFMHKSLS